METEELIKTNGGELLPDDKAYLFDAPEVKVEVDVGKGVIVTHVLSKPTFDDHLDRERTVRRVTRVGANQEMTTEYSESDANSQFYNNLVQRAFAQKGGDTLKEYEMEECKQFTFETKDKAVERMYQSWFEVEDEDDDPLAILFEREGTMIIRQEIGEEDRPSYVVKYKIQIPSKSQRQDYDANQFKRKSKHEKRNKTTIETTFNLSRGVKLFNALFQGVQGGRIKSGAYSPELKAEYLEQIDALFKNGVVNVAVAHFNKSSD